MTSRRTPGCSTALLLTVLFVAAAGCFDVHGVPTAAVVFDDFNDGDLQPNDARFTPWASGIFNPPGEDDSYGVEPDDAGGYSFVARATVVDPPDKVQQTGGMWIGSESAQPEDFLRFQLMRFRNRLEPGNPPIPAEAQAYVQIGCSTAAMEDGTVPGTLYVSHGVPYADAWQTVTLEMSDFSQPAWMSARPIRGGTTACLSRADNVTFGIDAELSDGQTGEIVMHIDDITFY